MIKYFPAKNKPLSALDLYFIDLDALDLLYIYFSQRIKDIHRLPIKFSNTGEQLYGRYMVFVEMKSLLHW